MFIDPDIYSKKERTNIAKGVYLSPLCKVCPRNSWRKTRWKIFPSSLLSPFKRVYVALLLVEKVRTNIVKRSNYSPLVKVCPRIFYMNCSKYFSLKPVSGNLNTFCLPSFVV